MTRLAVLLVVTAQLADLAMLGLAQGHGTEVGPLAPLLASGGYGAVVVAKCVAIAAMLAILARLRSRRLALLAATAGVIGAATGLAALV